MKTVCRIKNFVLETIKGILSSFFNYTNIQIYKYTNIQIYKSYSIITLNGIFVNCIKFFSEILSRLFGFLFIKQFNIKGGFVS